jgi:GST-like protein
MIKFFFHPTPNPAKVALALEEMGLEYQIVPVDTRKGEQHAPEFLKINPNAKLPALDIDGDVIFDGNAIRLHLAQLSGKFGVSDTVKSTDLLSWMMFIATGVGPYSGQAVHFLRMAPEDLPYAKNRYLKEVQRHYRILDDRLGQSAYLAGSTYSIADMSMWGWARAAGFIMEGGLDSYPNVKRVFDEISARPAAIAAEGLKEKHTFKQEMDEEAKRAMFPQNY